MKKHPHMLSSKTFVLGVTLKIEIRNRSIPEKSLVESPLFVFITPLCYHLSLFTFFLFVIISLFSFIKIDKYFIFVYTHRQKTTIHYEVIFTCRDPLPFHIDVDTSIHNLKEKIYQVTIVGSR